MLDEEVKLILLTYDKMFKGIFKERLDILKLFILSQLELDISPDECKIELLDSELHYEFMIDMGSNRKYFEEWELQQLNEWVEYTARKNAIEEGFEEKFENGMQQGVERGINQGIVQGIEQGIKQNVEITIKNMLKENLSVELIAKITGKSEEEIVNIKNSL